MIFTPYRSSSAGNAYLVADERTTILLECGGTFKSLQRLLGFSVASLDGCLISHEHKDHAGCVKQIIKAGVPTYLSQGTARALFEDGTLTEDLVGMANEMEAGRQFEIGSLEIKPFPLLHDAEEPLGFLIHSTVDGETLVFCIDTVRIPYRFPQANILCLEANFDPALFAWLDEEIEDDGSLDGIKRRQMRKRMERVRHTHMSIDILCGWLRHQDLSNVREIWLMHLSDGNSSEENFSNRVFRAVTRHVRINICPKEVKPNG